MLQILQTLNPMNKTQSLIDNYFDQLTIFIDNLPLKDEGKSYLWYYCYLNFYSTPQISEDGNTTIGIKTIAQLENFRALLKNNLEKVRNKAIINWTDSLNKIDPTTAITKIQESQYKIRQKEFLEEIGGEKINDWDIWFKDFLDNELYHQLNRRKSEKDLGEKQPEKSFPDYLKHKEPEKFASLIKKEFPGIKGRDSAALYQALKSLKLIETTKY